MLSAINALRHYGAVYLSALSASQVAEVNAYLADKPVFADAHVPQTARNAGRGEVPKSELGASECFCVHTTHALLAPHILETALCQFETAAAYLGVDLPYLYSANAFWTRPGPGGSRPDIQEFHRDADDERFLAMFTFLTDVTLPEDGATELEGPTGTVQFLGPAGTAFLADTSWPHRGQKPWHRERGIHWFRWGVSRRPEAYRWDGLSPVPAAALGERYPRDPDLRRAIEPLVSLP